MDIGKTILSELIFAEKYARYRPDLKRRETYSECVDRNYSMHTQRLTEGAFPDKAYALDLLETAYDFVYSKKVLPSMRSLQFAGEPILQKPTKIYNCAYAPFDSAEMFGELMWLLLCGCGVGYSVRTKHVEKLPILRERKPGSTARMRIPDTIEGWADSIQFLVNSFYAGIHDVQFDYTEIRPAGSPLSFGGYAPGAGPLKSSHEAILRVLVDAYNEVGAGAQLRPIHVHDVACHISNAVMSGGIRRAAMIALFSHTDKEMLHCKEPQNLVGNEQRYRANNSVVLPRDYSFRYKKVFDTVFNLATEHGTGEPGIFWISSLSSDDGTNPCAEIGLKPFQFCNLTEVSVEGLESYPDPQAEFEARCFAGGVLGTMQASYTDFPYLRPIWKETTEKEALLGVSLTGLASIANLQRSNFRLSLWSGAEVVKLANEKMARALGINIAARTTCVKPSGTASLVLGCSSGIHPWHSQKFLRRIRMARSSPISRYLEKTFPFLCEPSVEPGKEKTELIFSVPIKAPNGAITRHDEDGLSLFQRVQDVNDSWVAGGHRFGDQPHNVSATLSVREGELEALRYQMWHSRGSYNALSMYPYSDAVYAQAPLEDCSDDLYESLIEQIQRVVDSGEYDLRRVVEESDNTQVIEEAACAGGACEIR